jgi:hypothetical protein
MGPANLSQGSLSHRSDRAGWTGLTQGSDSKQRESQRETFAFKRRPLSLCCLQAHFAPHHHDRLSHQLSTSLTLQDIIHHGHRRRARRYPSLFLERGAAHTQYHGDTESDIRVFIIKRRSLSRIDSFILIAITLRPSVPNCGLSRSK